MTSSHEPFALEHVEGVPVLYLRGEMASHEDTHAARQQIEVLVDTNQIDRLAVDCSQARAMNSTLVGMIMSIHLKLRLAEGRLRLCGLSQNLRDMCRVARIDDVLPIDATLEDALAILRD